MAESRLVRSTVVALFLLGSAAAAWGKPLPPLEVQIATAEWSAGDLLRAQVTVRFLTATEAARIVVRSAGALHSRPYSEEVRGPFADGDTYEFALDVRAVHAGDGEVTVQVESLGSGGAVLHARKAELFGKAEEGGIWTSPSSPTDLQLRRIARLSSTGKLLAQEGHALLEEVVTARAAVDHEPRAERPFSPVEKRIQAALAPLLVKPSAIEVMPSPSAVNLTVQGRAEWTDRNGKRHGIPMATVEIRDSDLVGSDLVATVSTDAAGNYQASFSHDDGPLQGNPDVFVRVLARSPVADVKPDSLLFAETYRLESPVQEEVAGGSTLTLNLVAGSSADSETAFSVHHALVVIGSYTGGLTGRVPSQIVTRFPTTASTSKFTSNLLTGSAIHILLGDRWDWDVIHHEYGHYVMAIHGIQANPGKGHRATDNLTSRHGSKDIGIRLAWGEGWPTFFAISGQQMSGAAGLGVPDVGDVRYQDTDDTTIDHNLETESGLGEDNELSVMTALWDLFDGPRDGADDLSSSDRVLFNRVKGAAAKTVGAAWEAFAAAFDTEGKTKVGAVFGQAKIAPELLEPADGLRLRAGDPPPTFRWRKNGGGTPNPLNDFKIVFYKEGFSDVVFEKELGDTDSFTPSGAELGTILGEGPVRWVVEGKDTRGPATPGGALGRYWSGSRKLGAVVSIVFVVDDTGSMGEEIGGVRDGLQRFIDELGSRLAGAEPPTIQLITFKDDVTSRLITNDLAAMRAEVGALVASGGDDCPEFSAHALQAAAESVSVGGSILLATDASPQPGVNLGAVISRLRAKGVTVNTLLSGDCTGIASPSRSRPGAPSLDNGQAQPIFDSSRARQESTKPGGDDGDDRPQDPIDDPGQDPGDEHGDTAEQATVLPVDGETVRGSVTSGDRDLFRLSLEGGETVAVTLEIETGSGVLLSLLDTDGTTVLRSTSLFGSGLAQIAFTPTSTGDFFLSAEPAFGGSAVYLVGARRDPFALLTSAVETFSTVSAQTGGAFLVRDEVNSGDAEGFELALLNLLVSTVGPSVLASDPQELPQGTTLSVNLTGRNTNWRPGTTVKFSGTGVDVVGASVVSATALVAEVQVAPGAALDLRDVEVTTLLGGGAELAIGRGVVDVVTALTSPTLLSVEPNVLGRGETQHLLLRGVNTAWGAASLPRLGPGISVVSAFAESPTRMRVEVSVEPTAAIGFRSAEVQTGASVQNKTRALFVQSALAVLPQITSVTPAEAAPGQTVTLLVHGLNTGFQAGATTASLGDGVEVLAVEVLDGQNVRLTVRVLPGAASGFRNVNVTTGSEVAVLLDGFFVDSAGPGQDVTEIPTLSQWGMLLTQLLLAACAVFLLRRRALAGGRTRL